MPRSPNKILETKMTTSTPWIIKTGTTAAGITHTPLGMRIRLRPVI